MKVLELNYNEYSNYNFESHIFNGLDFIEFNKDKCTRVIFLVFKDSKIRFGLPVGIKNNIIKSPFSAPFGGITYKKNNAKHISFSIALKALNNYARLNKYDSIEFFLPPSFYDKDNHAKFITAALMSDFSVNFIEINHSFNLKNFGSDYLKFINYGARKALNIAFAKELTFSVCITDEQKINAYNIIKKNRQERGFPLKLSQDDIFGTIGFIKSFFFIVSLPNGVGIASAICYEVQNEIIQIIYWGNLTKYSDNKPINFLSYKLFDFFKNLNYKVIDIGPSSEDGIVNYGLSDFKESIGCDKYLKFNLINKLNNNIE